jgi:hypothetical protein
MENKITNEFGETITKKEIEEIAKAIQELSVKDIDDLFYKCSWIDSEKGENKALPDWRLHKIKEDLEFARISIRNLFCECDKKTFLEVFNA